MNKWCGTGRLTRDFDVRQAGETKVAKTTIAVNRRFKAENQPDADFIPIEIWGKRAEFAEKYFSKGMKAEIEGEIQTNTYKDKDGNTVYGWHVKCDQFDFCESKGNSNSTQTNEKYDPSIPDNIPDSELPFN